MPPPVIYLAFFLVGIALQRYLPVPRLSMAIGRIVGPALVLSGLMLVMWSVKRFWASGTSVVPIRPTTALVIQGPYRFTRNPMYLGLLLLYMGIAFWLGFAWPLFLAPVLVWTIGASVIGREERYLTRKFGSEYQQYQARVRRWL